MDRIRLTRAIKAYIKAHPEMQRANVPLYAMEECARKCQCLTYHVMVVLQLGSL